MTTCELIVKPIVRMVEEEKKSLDEIAAEVCPKVKHGREKIIRVIKDFISPDYLVIHSSVLGYDVDKAELAKKRNFKSHKKIDAGADGGCCASQSVGEACDNANVCGSGERSANSLNSFSGDVHEVVRRCIEIFGLNRVLDALESIINEVQIDTTEEPSANKKCPQNLEAIDKILKSQGG